ncbi:MAG: hypothetical protein M3Y41_17410, partial [Pseudomonadota bacterium]|nr:hypothetical protein [Pseudomonadota bacterium]
TQLTLQPDPITLIASEMPPRQFQHNSRRHHVFQHPSDFVPTEIDRQNGIVLRIQMGKVPGWMTYPHTKFGFKV